MITQVGSWSSSKWLLASARNLSRDQSGSWHFVLKSRIDWEVRRSSSRLKAERRELAGAIILECVGFAKSEAGTQQTPPAVPIAVPTQGDFLAIVGNEASRSLVLQLEQEAQRQAAPLKTLSLVVPGRGEAMPHTRRSDHASFWDAGYPAVVLTDTANFRNPHYHRETDTVDTLNLEFLSSVAATVTATAIQIAGVRP